MAIEVVIRNNKELIRGVDRAKNVTISALKIAVTVASALYNQKIVLQKIELLNQTTNDLIAGTSKMLKDQGIAIQKQAYDASISVDTMKQAFTDVLSALDSISVYKQEALPRMRRRSTSSVNSQIPESSRFSVWRKGRSWGCNQKREIKRIRLLS